MSHSVMNELPVLLSFATSPLLVEERSNLFIAIQAFQGKGVMHFSNHDWSNETNNKMHPT